MDLDISMEAIDDYIGFVQNKQSESFDPRRDYLVDCLNELKEDIINRYLDSLRSMLVARYID